VCVCVYIYILPVCLYRSRKDKHLYIVPDHPESQLDRSFAELELFTENTTDVVWKFVRNLHHRPYETTLETFAKLTDIWCKYIKVMLYGSNNYTYCPNFKPSLLLQMQLKICFLRILHTSHYYHSRSLYFIWKERSWYLNVTEIGAIFGQKFHHCIQD
jgi:hypothetical protein